MAVWFSAAARPTNWETVRETNTATAARSGRQYRTCKKTSIPCPKRIFAGRSHNYEPNRVTAAGVRRRAQPLSVRQVVNEALFLVNDQRLRLRSPIVLNYRITAIFMGSGCDVGIQKRAFWRLHPTT